MKCKSGLCRDCQRKYWLEQRNELCKNRIDNHCCMDCGVKVVKSYPLKCDKCAIRCEKCGERQRRYAKKRYEKSKELK
jgi:hypothetical protein